MPTHKGAAGSWHLDVLVPFLAAASLGTAVQGLLEGQHMKEAEPSLSLTDGPGPTDLAESQFCLVIPSPAFVIRNLDSIG